MKINSALSVKTGKLRQSAFPVSREGGGMGPAASQPPACSSRLTGGAEISVDKNQMRFPQDDWDLESEASLALVPGTA